MVIRARATTNGDIKRWVFVYYTKVSAVIRRRLYPRL